MRSMDIWLPPIFGHNCKTISPLCAVLVRIRNVIYSSKATPWWNAAAVRKNGPYRLNHYTDRVRDLCHSAVLAAVELDQRGLLERKETQDWVERVIEIERCRVEVPVMFKTLLNDLSEEFQRQILWHIPILGVEAEATAVGVFTERLGPYDDLATMLVSRDPSTWRAYGNTRVVSESELASMNLVSGFPPIDGEDQPKRVLDLQQT